MLRHDSESSQCLLYSGTVKTWFKAILENRKMSKTVLLGFASCCFFSKIAAGGYRKHEPYVFFLSNTCNTFMKYIHAIHTCNTWVKYIHAIHTCNTYMKYIHAIHTCNTYMKYMHQIHTWNTYMKDIHAKHIWNTYMQYIHAIRTCNTDMQYRHAIQTWSAYMKHTHAIQPKNGGISVTGTPKIALKNIWRVLTYAVFHTEFEFSIKLGGYWARM